MASDLARAALVAALIVAGAGVVGVVIAGQRDAPLASPSPTAVPETVALAKVEPPPAEPPGLAIEGRTVAPLYVSWTVDGATQTVTPPPTATAHDYPLVDVDGQLDVRIDSGVRPAVVNVRYYRFLAPGGLPRDQEDSHVECLRSNDSCDILVESDSVHLTADVDPAGVFVVVEVFYDNASMGSSPYSIVTFGFNVRATDG